jgi:hypothetical protein
VLLLGDAEALGDRTKERSHGASRRTPPQHRHQAREDGWFFITRRACDIFDGKRFIGR